MTAETRTVKDEYDSKIYDYIQSLLAFKPDKVSQDRRALAELRGVLHGQPRDYLRAGKYVVPYLIDDNYILQNERDFTEECFFQIGGLYAWGQGAISYHKGVSIGDALRKLRQSGNSSESLDGRFLTLLNSPPNTYFIHLRQMIDLLRSTSSKAGGMELDWELLLKDTLAWKHEEQYVQRRWARGYYRDAVNKNRPEPPDGSDNKGTAGEQR